MSYTHDAQYINGLIKLIDQAIENGFNEDRTKVGTASIFGTMEKYKNVGESFPLLQTKKTAFGLVKSELLWFLKGDTNIKYLLQHNNHIWDEWGFEKYVNSPDYKGPDMKDFGRRCLLDSQFNLIYREEMRKYTREILENDEFAKKHGELGPVYGRQWRSWEKQDIANSVKLSKDGITFTQNPSIGIDQITNVIEQIKTNPTSRRLIVSAWNPEEVKDMALPPCHTLFQFNSDGKTLDLSLMQRSQDKFLGGPFNIASYSLLLMMVAKEVGLKPGNFIHFSGNTHLYSNHLDQAEEQIMRFDNAKKENFSDIKVVLDYEKSIFDVEPKDIKLENYKHMGIISAPIAV